MGKNILRRIGTILLALAVTVTMVPLVPQSGEASAASVGSPRVTADKTTWDCVYFGSYPQGSDGNGGFKTEPIKWRVLHVDGDDAFLLADRNLDAKRYNKQYVDITWEECTMRSWLNGYSGSYNSSGIDYSSNNFIDTAFSASEKKAINEVTVTNADNPEYGTTGGNDTRDKIFLLSIAETIKTSYGFSSSYGVSETREAKNTSYVASASGMCSEGSLDIWWLRSPGSYSGYAASVIDYGNVDRHGLYVNYDYYAVRPALHLNLKSSIWSYAGTVSSDGTEDVTGGSSGKYEYKDVNNVPIDTAAVSGGKLSLFQKASGKVGNSKVLKFFPGNFTLDFPAADTKIKKESQGDGTYKVKISIGVADTENGVLTSKKRWNSFKSDILDAKRNVANLKTLTSVMKKYGYKKGSMPFTSKWKAEAKLMGYYEAIVDQKGNLISDEGGAILEVSGKKTWGQTMVTAPIPIPYYVEFGGSAKAKGSIGIGGVVGKSGMVLKGKVSINPEIILGAGVGAHKVASAGVEGRGGVDIQVYPPSKGDLTFGAAIKLMFLSMEYTFDVATAKFSLWDTTKKTSVKTIQSVNVMNRSMMMLSSGWSPDEEGGIETLQDYIYQNTVPVMANVGDKTVLVFQTCDMDRAAVDSLKLVYSVYDGSTWTDPQPVMDNGAVDAVADIKVIGGKLYAAWQKCNSTIDAVADEEKASELAQKSEICVACFNSSTGEFEDAQFLTSNSDMDYLPALVDEEGNPAVIWARNGSNDLTGAEGTKKVYVSEYSNGSWQDENELCEVNGIITSLNGIFSEENVTVGAVTADMETGSTSVKVSCSDGSMTSVENSDSVAIGSIISEDGAFRYGMDGSIHRYDVSSGEITSIQAGEGEVIPDNAQILKDGDKKYIVWMENSESGCSIYSSVLMDGGYSEPVEIFSRDGISGRYFSTVMAENGEKNIVLNVADIDNSENASLYSFMVKSEPKAELEDVLISEGEAEDGTVPVSYVVKNNSEETMTSYTFSMKNSDGTIVSRTVSCDIAPGEEKYVEEQVEMDGSLSGDEIITSVQTDGQTDVEGAEISETIDFRNVELDVEKNVKGDNLSFHAAAKNTGDTTFSGTISFYGDAAKTISLDSEEFTDLAPGETAEADFEIKAENISLTWDDAAQFAIDVKDENGSDIGVSNTYYGILYGDEMPDEEFAFRATAMDTLDISGIEDKVYNGNERTQSVVVKEEDKTLEEGVDYILQYENNIDVGSATVEIIGQGNYRGSVTEQFEITPAELGSMTLSDSKYSYSGQIMTPDVTVYDGNGRILKEGADYMLSYPSGRIAAGKYTVKATGCGNYTGTASSSFTINADVNNNPDMLNVMVDDAVYTGKEAQPAVTIEFGGAPLERGKDFDVQCSDVNVGSATAVIQFKGYYSGSIRKTFRINPKGATIITPKAAKKAFTAKWKKQSAKMSKTRITGYQVRYSLKKGFKSGVKTKTVKGYRKTSVKISKLKAKKTYYVQVRTYKTVNGKKYYSKWSKTKTVKTK